MEQNKLLKAEMADLKRVVSKNGNPVGRVITKVEPVAARLSPKIIEKIKEHKYVNFVELLEGPEEPEETNQTLSSDGRGNSIIFQSKHNKTSKKFLSFQEWGVAWSRFIGILTEDSPDRSLTANLSQHYEVVFGLMKSGGDWQKYDKKFRKLVETDPEVTFGSLHFDLYQAAKSAVKTPSGKKPICYQFNSRRGCSLFYCSFSHSCSRCSLPHPAHQCPHRPFSYGQSVPQPAARLPVPAGRFPAPATSSQQSSFRFGQGLTQYSSRTPRPFLPRGGQNSYFRPSRPQGPRY